jgi:serine/threonine protein kinase/tetratricopeptide (TPR) repeat protein
MKENILHYRILEKIGEGGMGVVYKAEDTSLKRTVALKFLPENALVHDDDKKRFIREAQAAAALDHPNICAVHEIEETEGRVFITMAYCDGRTLQQRLADGPLPPRYALDIAIQVASGLQEAHEKGVIHRDIKPGNIIISDKNHARITDFGLAKVTSETTLTQSVTTAGTLHYMSPEILRGEKSDPRADIWSLGVVLYQILTGKLPFGGDYPAAVLYSIVSESPLPPSELSESVPTELDAIIMRALQKDPDARYSSMQEMLPDLQKLRKRLTATSMQPIIPRRKKRFLRPLPKTTVVLILALLTIVIIFIVAQFWPKETIDVPISVAVLEFESKSENPVAKESYIDYLLMKLEEQPDIDILKYVPMMKLFIIEDVDTDDLQMTMMACRKVGVEAVIRCEVLEIGNEKNLWAHVYDTASEKELFPFNVGPGDSMSLLLEELSIGISEQIDIMKRNRIWNLSDKIDSRSPNEIAQRLITAAGYLDKGKSIYNSGGNPQEAIPLIKKAITYDPTLKEFFVDGHHKLALWHNYTGDTELALYYAKLSQEASRGNEADSLRSVIIEMRVLKNWNEASSLMKAYLGTYRDDVKMHLDLGYILYRNLKEYSSSIIYLEEAIALDPENATGLLAKSYNCLGHAYLYDHQYEEAMVAFDDYYRIAASKVDPLHSKAFAFHFMGDYSAAINAYKEAMKLNSGYFVIYDYIGLAYLDAGQWAKAIESFEAYIEKAPHSMKVNGYRHIGYVHLIQRNTSGVERAANEAFELNPDFIEAYWLLGQSALFLGGDIQKAQDALDAMEAIADRKNVDWKIAYIYSLRGFLHIENNEYERGLDSLRKAATASAPDMTLFDRELIRGYLLTGNYDEALREVSRLLSFNGNDAFTLSLAGEASEAAGAVAEAQGYYERARTVWNNADRNFQPLIYLHSKSGGS